MWLYPIAELDRQARQFHKSLSRTATGPGAVYLYKPLLHLILPPSIEKVQLTSHKLDWAGLELGQGWVGWAGLSWTELPHLHHITAAPHITCSLGGGGRRAFSEWTATLQTKMLNHHRGKFVCNPSVPLVFSSVYATVRMVCVCVCVCVCV